MIEFSSRPLSLSFGSIYFALVSDSECDIKYRDRNKFFVHNILSLIHFKLSLTENPQKLIQKKLAANMTASL